MNKKEIEEKIKKAEEELKEAREMLAKCEEDKNWKPKLGEIYCYLDSSNCDNGENWRNDYIDNYRYDIGNCFKTREEAKHRAELVETERQLMKYACEHNDEIDWNDGNQHKFYFLYDGNDGKIGIMLCWKVKNARTIYFSSREIAQQAIQEIGEEKVKQYLKEM